MKVSNGRNILDLLTTYTLENPQNLCVILIHIAFNLK